MKRKKKKVPFNLLTHGRNTLGNMILIYTKEVYYSIRNIDSMYIEVFCYMILIGMIIIIGM
jgi:hypothetical protein